MNVSLNYGDMESTLIHLDAKLDSHDIIYLDREKEKYSDAVSISISIQEADKLAHDLLNIIKQIKDAQEDELKRKEDELRKKMMEDLQLRNVKILDGRKFIKYVKEKTGLSEDYIVDELDDYIFPNVDGYTIGVVPMIVKFPLENTEYNIKYHKRDKDQNHVINFIIKEFGADLIINFMDYPLD